MANNLVVIQKQVSSKIDVSESGILDAANSTYILLVIALFSDLLTPLLIWKGILPEQTRWISHVATALLIFITYARMMIANQIPSIMLLIGGLSITGISVAIYRGQGLIATTWGWWIMFQFPFIGLFAFFQRTWPENFLDRLRNLCVVILVLQILVQIVQYLTGQYPGDNLAGTFGWHGTGNLIIFIVLVYSLALGYWIVNQNWKPLILIIILGGLSSVFGEMKFFPLAITLLSGIALLIYTQKTNRLSRLISYGLLLATMLVLFIIAYNTVVPAAQKSPLQGYLEDPTRVINYLFRAEKSFSEGTMYYDIGRNFALEYGWEQIKRDPLTFLFGFGLGARGESQALNSVGIAIELGRLGRTSGTSLLVIMQEFGLIGLMTLGGFVLWVATRLLKIIRESSCTNTIGTSYGLLLFTLLWPLWLWYNAAWTLRVPMLLYWTALGFIMQKPNGQSAQINE